MFVIGRPQRNQKYNFKITHLSQKQFILQNEEESNKRSKKCLYTASNESLVVDVVPILAGSPPTQEHPTVTGDHQDANNEDGPQSIGGSSNEAWPGN